MTGETGRGWRQHQGRSGQTWANASSVYWDLVEHTLSECLPHLRQMAPGHHEEGAIFHNLPVSILCLAVQGINDFVDGQPGYGGSSLKDTTYYWKEPQPASQMTWVLDSVLLPTGLRRSGIFLNPTS